MDAINNKENQFILETKGLCYEYHDGTKALIDVNLSIQKHKTTAIIGGNGAGKTTLFLHLNGILEPTSGVVCFKDEPLTYKRGEMTTLRSKVGIVFQDPDNQLFSASVSKDISFGLKNMGLPDAEIKELVDNAIKTAGIEGIRDKPTHFLSFGQKKRVAIAGVLAMQPEVLILDEPTAGLDPQGVTELMHFLVEMQKNLGISVVIATHDMDMIPLYCDYIYVIDQGRVLMEGTSDQVFSRTKELRMANLRLPRIGHLMEILSIKDGMPLQTGANTISGARRSIKGWMKDKKTFGRE